MSDNGEIYTAGKSFTLPPALTALTNSTSDLHFHIADADGLCDISYVIFCCNVYVTIVEGDLKELSRSLVCILLSIAQIAVNRQQFSPLLYIIQLGIFPHSLLLFSMKHNLFRAIYLAGMQLTTYQKLFNQFI